MFIEHWADLVSKYQQISAGNLMTVAFWCANEFALWKPDPDVKFFGSHYCDVIVSGGFVEILSVSSSISVQFSSINHTKLSQLQHEL